MNFKSIFKVIIGVSVITAGANLFAGILLSKLMSPGEYGLYAYWQSVVALLSNIIPYGTVAIVSVFRYSGSFNLFREKLSYGILIIMPFTAALFILGAILTNELGFEISLSIVCISVVLVYFNVHFIIYTSLLRAEHLLNKYAVLMISGSVLLVVSQIVSWIIFKNVKSIFVTLIFVNGAIAVFSMLKIIERKMLFDFNFRSICFSKIKWNLSYGFPIVVSSVAMSFLTIGDKILYKNYSSSEDFGEYAKFTLIAGAAMFIVNNFAAAWGTFLSKNLSGMNASEARELFKSGSKHLYLGGVMCVIFLTPCIVIFFGIIYGWKPLYYVIPLFYLTTGYVLYGMSKFYIGFLMYYKKNYGILYATLIACGILCLGFYFTSNYSQNTVSFIVACSYFSYFLILKMLCLKLLNNLELICVL